MAKEKIEEKEKELKWAVSNVPTQHTPMVVNTETNEAYPIEEALVNILNTLEELKGLL